MIKKILIYLSICTSFIFCFLFGKYINTLAYFENSNTIGVYPAKLDIDKYDNYSLIDLKKFSFTRNGVSVSVENNIITFNGTSTLGTSQSIGYTVVNDYVFDSNKNYTMVGEILSGSITSEYDTRETIFRIAGGDDAYWYRFIVRPDNNIYRNKELRSYKELGIATIQFGDLITFDNFKIKIMLTEYDNRDLPIVTPLKYGNRVGYQLNLYNPTSSNINTNVKIKNYDNVVVSRNVTINSNSYYEMIGNISINSSGTTDTTFYLPYNIANDGTISFDYKLSIIIDNTNVVIKSDENISSDTYFFFEPVFSGYYKGEFTNNLYFKNSYTFNSINYIGMNANGNGLNNIYFSCIGELPNNCIQDSIFISPNKPTNILANNVISTGIRNNINFDEVFLYNYTSSYGFELTDRLFSFQLNIGNTTDSITSGVIYNVNISNISLSIINDSSTSSPLPNNPNTDNKYNTCDAWYDIPCQLGNAITYVIYEAPIISPIVEFITTFIDGLQYVITYIKWFEGLGIVFSLFIFILMIRLLIMLIKGSNDDRGGNK